MRQPTLYISHGGGPCFWMRFPPPIGEHGFDGLRDYLAGIIPSLPQPPKAIVVISAHWEEENVTVGIAAKPEMIFDYYGFPEHTYQLSYPAPGSPEIAAQVQNLLEKAGIKTVTDTKRGFDHGVFVPFLIMEPSASIPVVTLSLRHDLDPAAHIAIGAALEPLRDDNILIIGSGSSYHNLRAFFDGKEAHSRLFDDWLAQTATNADIDQRNAQLTQWAKAPAARDCHPREEHLLPLMVAAGAAGRDVGRQSLATEIGNKAISCFRFG